MKAEYKHYRIATVIASLFGWAAVGYQGHWIIAELKFTYKNIVSKFTNMDGDA
jgi:hypothetical protein